MYYVYLINSINYPETFYVGYTTNLDQRLETHNSGGSIHTAKSKPWKLIMYLGFVEQARAKEFACPPKFAKLESMDKRRRKVYLKSQSGRAFLNKRFL